MYSELVDGLICKVMNRLSEAAMLLLPHSVFELM